MGCPVSADDEAVAKGAPIAGRRSSGRCTIVPLDVRDELCHEIDDPQDLAVVTNRLREVEKTDPG
ncbi:MAG: hypothetical protein HFG22_07925 [Lachnospiraceae bacterium]|nr:hypothetical protein [Lachnospiraceae bacterium]